ncbi:MAG TPA: site-specific integrase [Pyrinomonadaceae bacterium]|nr:site-specific integrase [Pyrinomonadaceae bacterium]
MKSRSGYVFHDKKGNWFARVTYTDRNGKRKNIQRKVENKSKGDELLKKLVNSIDSDRGASVEAEKLTFKDLAEHYEKHYLKEAQYVNDRKVSGLRSVVSVRGYVNVLKEYFGKQKLRTITYEDLLTFRNTRLKTPTHQSEQRSISTVNREMAYLRRLLNIAERNGWISRNPFKCGDSLIHIADERKRERILTREEETKLLSQCVGSRKHLRPLIIAGLDTGCRLGELLKLRFKDIDFDEDLITIQAFNTKTMRERQISITIRLKQELEKLYAANPSPESTVFGIKCEVRQGFKNACTDAGIAGVTFYTLRHTAATRLVSLHIPLAEVGKVLGHTTPNTTYRYYLNPNLETVRRAAAALDCFNAQEQPTQETVSEALKTVN